MTSTELRMQRPAGAEAAFRLARKAFIAGERIDMQRLAAELGVNRVTLYRWIGNRAHLLGEVAWESPTARSTAGSSARLAGAASASPTSSPGSSKTSAPTKGCARPWLRKGPSSSGFFTAGEGAVQPRLVEKFRSLILEAEVTSGAFMPGVALDEIAYALVRVCEACIYLDLLVDQHPDLDRVARMIRAVIGE